MELQVKQISSLEKVRGKEKLDFVEIDKRTVLQGERFSYQLCLASDSQLQAQLCMESSLTDAVRLYQVKEAVLDCPVTEPGPQEDYLTKDPCLMPDILLPLETAAEAIMKNTAFDKNAEPGENTELVAHTISITQHFSLTPYITTIWVKVDIPKDCRPGNYAIRFAIHLYRPGQEPAGVLYKTMRLEVRPVCMPVQKLIYTRWFYADCIAVAHDVPVYSEAHWNLIEKYIAAAADVGINMILVPIHTPPLDTEVGTCRPCVQLVDIEKKGERYFFSFEKFKRFIDICKRNGITHFEMAHMFSQWGAEHAPNIRITENGETVDYFGWHTDASSEEYVAFLQQYIPAIEAELTKEGISENTYFHISDEPTLENMATYEKASSLIRPLIGNSKTFDALSHYDFYEKGLVECPVTVVSSLAEFLKHPIENQWAYYCCGPQYVYTNSFMAMPSYRTRILGFLLYKYDIKGFLHWGFNYYNSCRSWYPVNPYLTTSGDKAYPSGDPFIVYPGKEEVYPSIRGEVTYEGIQDMQICTLLEAKIGREAVVKRIDEAAGEPLTFENYPKTKDYLERLREDMIRILE